MLRFAVEGGNKRGKMNQRMISRWFCSRSVSPNTRFGLPTGEEKLRPKSAGFTGNNDLISDNLRWEPNLCLKRDIPSSVRSLTFYVKFEDAKLIEAVLALIGDGKGFAFVAFKESEAVPLVLQLDGSIFKKRSLRVKRVQKKNKVDKEPNLSTFTENYYETTHSSHAV
ncbi:unnamed protein product [Acanthocheilonema viteae]|uniref:RRM domain-containing protein n=1 Tax=Acanthocheilonema viteae TaxID=6277 RepID=A0A498SEH6_ACAVI|nr:unnamed protein product [Acanthocheilonema viteae]